MTRTNLQTALVGRKVRVISLAELERRYPGGHGRFCPQYAGCQGEIVNVYLTKDGVCYDLLFADLDGVLWVDCWSGFFTVE